MSRGTWSVYIQGSGNSWIPDGSIYRPNSDLPIPFTGTQMEALLADGTIGYSTPQNVYNNDPITISWMNVDQTFLNQLLGYLQNADFIKIVTHLSGIVFIGRFVKVDPTWIIQPVDSFNITATFRIMSNI